MKQLFIYLIIISIGLAQDFRNIIPNNPENINEKSLQLNQNVNLTSLENLTYTPVEKPIDPDTYILGPGDLLGISIISTTNVSLPLRVNPIGEILIPSVGIIKVNGLSLTDARKLINEYVRNNVIQNAITNITLLDIRRFKVKILGAVNNPGDIYLSSIDGIHKALLQGGGVQKFAHPGIVQIIRENEIFDINLKKYLSGEDNSQNINIRPGDIVYVPFNDYAKSIGIDHVSYNENHITVFGFVSKNSGGNTFRYYPGYKVRDYIALAGGTKEQNSSFRAGNLRRTKIYRSNGLKINNAINEIVFPGDIIEVPPSLFYQLIGGDGIVRTLASIASSAYIVYKFTQE